MVLPGGEDGVQVDAVDAEAGEVVEVLRNASYRAAELAVRSEAAELALRRLPAYITAGAGEAVREDVVDHGLMHPVRHAGDVCAVVEGKLEILRAVVHQLVREHAAVVIAALRAVRELEVVEDAVIGALQCQLPPVVVFVREDALHRLREPVYGRFAAGGIAVPERHALQVAPRGAQAQDYAPLVQAVGVFGHWDVQYGFLFHAILSHLPQSGRRSYASGRGRIL